MRLQDMSPFGASSWPTEFGTAASTNTTSGTFSTTGRTLWSIPLSCSPSSVAEDGCVFALDRTQTTAIDPDGVMRWSIATSEAGEISALADGSLLMTEDGRLVRRDQKTGKELWSRTKEGWWFEAPQITRNGNIVHFRNLQDSERDVELCFLTAEGEVVWTYPLKGPYHSVLVLDVVIVFKDHSYLGGLTYNGKLSWIANRHGFLSADETTDKPRFIKNEEFTTRPMRLDPSRIVIGGRWYDGFGFLIMDIPGRSVSLWADGHLGGMHERPLTLIAGNNPRIVGHHLELLRCYDMSGRNVFDKTLRWEALNIISDASGNVVASTSVDRGYWEKYLESYRLHDRCGLTCVDPEGNELFRWVAPGPLREPLAVGKEGEIYCWSEGKLWAVA